ncbi:hypothetical protein ES703_118983 [subsurface metagenome]
MYQCFVPVYEDAGTIVTRYDIACLGSGTTDGVVANVKTNYHAVAIVAQVSGSSDVSANKVALDDVTTIVPN